MIFPPQLRAARGLLNISQAELAERSGVGIATIKRIELQPHISGAARSVAKLQVALEMAGVVFVDQDRDNGPGVRLRAPISAI